MFYDKHYFKGLARETTMLIQVIEMIRKITATSKDGRIPESL